MTNSEHLLIAYFGQTEDDVWNDTMNAIQSILDDDDAIDAGVPNDFNFTHAG